MDRIDDFSYNLINNSIKVKRMDAKYVSFKQWSEQIGGVSETEALKKFNTLIESPNFRPLFKEKYLFRDVIRAVFGKITYVLMRKDLEISELLNNIDILGNMNKRPAYIFFLEGKKILTAISCEYSKTGITGRIRYEIKKKGEPERKTLFEKIKRVEKLSDIEIVEKFTHFKIMVIFFPELIPSNMGIFISMINSIFRVKYPQPGELPF